MKSRPKSPFPASIPRPKKCPQIEYHNRIHVQERLSPGAARARAQLHPFVLHDAAGDLLGARSVHGGGITIRVHLTAFIGCATPQAGATPALPCPRSGGDAPPLVKPTPPAGDPTGSHQLGSPSSLFDTPGFKDICCKGAFCPVSRPGPGDTGRREPHWPRLCNSISFSSRRRFSTHNGTAVSPMSSWACVSSIGLATAVDGTVASSRAENKSIRIPLARYNNAPISPSIHTVTNEPKYTLGTIEYETSSSWSQQNRDNILVENNLGKRSRHPTPSSC